MKKYLWMSLAALGFVACEKGIDNDNPQNGEMEQSYVAVSLMADDMTTRATGEGYAYEDGEPDERNVKSLYFFLFDEAGNPFPIDENKNYKAVAVNEEGNAPGNTDPAADGKPNVSDVKDKVLVFKNYKGKYPSKIVAVLNWAPAPDAAYSLDVLADQLSGLRNADNAFVMSNAVYVSESSNAAADKEAIRATALSEANIAKSEQDAKKNPVQIYVERIAAKVTVNTTPENKYDIGEEINGAKVYAKVTGWDLYNEYEQSYLLKKVNPNWNSTTVGFNWNDAAWFRSYWAISPTTSFDAEGNKVSYYSLTNAVADNDYCGENTDRAEGERTKVVVKALLVGEDNQPVEVATWYGNDYVGELALRTVVANTLASQLYYMDGTEYKSIEPNHLMVKEAFVEQNPNTSAEMKAYHVFFQLSGDGKAKEWHTYSAAEGFNAATDDAIDIILGGVEPALLYKGGQTYYYTDIKHLPSTNPDTQYGVVRNHVYKVNIGSIAGFGTPVYNGNTKFDPEEPAEITTYVSAEVRVLSWRVVEHNYDL